MIDPHVHCRDGRQAHKETIAHALSVAYRAGVSGIFDMPNTDPPVTTRQQAEERLVLADSAGSPVFYGLYIGVTADENQIREAVEAHKHLFPRVVGLKMFAGKSVGSLTVAEECQQRHVYETLAGFGYEGVLSVHCEKESMMKPLLWDPENPVSHFLARPPAAEIVSVFDQICFAEEYGFMGRLHIAHVSVPSSVDIVTKARKKGKIRVSCEATPQHLLLNVDGVYAMYASGKDTECMLLFKVNPPLRDLRDQREMWSRLENGEIDFIATDHAPHTYEEKTGKSVVDGKKQYLSGFPGLPFVPHFLEILRRRSFFTGEIDRLTHANAEGVFGLCVPRLYGVMPDYGLHTEYHVDVYKKLRVKL